MGIQPQDGGRGVWRGERGGHKDSMAQEIWAVNSHSRAEGALSTGILNCKERRRIIVPFGQQQH